MLTTYIYLCHSFESIFHFLHHYPPLMTYCMHEILKTEVIIISIQIISVIVIVIIMIRGRRIEIGQPRAYLAQSGASASRLKTCSSFDTTSIVLLVRNLELCISFDTSACTAFSHSVFFQQPLMQRTTSALHPVHCALHCSALRPVHLCTASAPS